eukprot:3006407-Rhodomonas_salina.4
MDSEDAEYAKEWAETTQVAHTFLCVVRSNHRVDAIYRPRHCPVLGYHPCRIVLRVFYAVSGTDTSYVPRFSCVGSRSKRGPRYRLHAFLTRSGRGREA